MALHKDSHHVKAMEKEIVETWENLNEIWSEVGYDPDNLARRQNAVVKHVASLLQEMKQEAEERLIEKREALDGLMTEIAQLAKDLTLSEVPGLINAAGKPLLVKEKLFLEIADDLRKRKALRMQKYNTINHQVIGISEDLDEVPMKIEFEGIPADSEVARLEAHLHDLHKEKARRLKLYLEYKASITELFGLLERSFANKLEQLVMESDEITSSHPVSDSGIKALSQTTLEELNQINSSLMVEIETNIEEGEKYWMKIRELWSRLNADEEMIHAFSQVHCPLVCSWKKIFPKPTWTGVYKPSVLKGLKHELERLEEEKRQNMGLFIKQVREELCEIWLSKCFMANVQVRFIEPNYLEVTPFTLADFTTDVFVEELLDLHEKEVGYWRAFADRNKKIIDGVIKRGHMFAEYKTLDQKSEDPNRLANRGGALLKEEKERKKLEKQIPKLEAELKQLCEVFEQSADEGHGMTKFLVYGRTIQEMIEQDWEQFHEEKRIRKEAKKKPNESVTTNKTLMTTQLVPGNRKRPHTPTSVQRGGVTPNKRNKTQVLTPGKTIQSPFAPPSTGPSSMKRPFASESSSAKSRGKSNAPKIKSSSSQYFRPNMSATNTGPRYVVKRTGGKTRNRKRSSLRSSNSSGSSSSNNHTNIQHSSLSQPNLKVSSLEQLDFTKVVRGPILEGLHEKSRIPQRAPSKENFAYPSTSSVSRSVKKTPSKIGTITRQASSGKIQLPTKLATGKEQVPPASMKRYDSKDTVVSPVASYSEFTDHLLCQSTLNSSAMGSVQKPAATTAPLTPTKSAPGMSFTPAKLPLSDNCF